MRGFFWERQRLLLAVFLVVLLGLFLCRLVVSLGFGIFLGSLGLSRLASCSSRFIADSLGFVSLGRCYAGRAADSNIVANLVHAFLAKTLDVVQVVHTLERAVLGTVVDDGLGFCRADPLDAFQFSLGGGIKVDCSECVDSKCKTGNQYEQQLLHETSPYFWFLRNR